MGKIVEQGEYLVEKSMFPDFVCKIWHLLATFGVYTIKYLSMSTIQIEILNPKAAKLIQDLADLDLISIRESEENEFTKLLKKLRSKSDSTPSLEEITNEVEMVRSLNYN